MDSGTKSFGRGNAMQQGRRQVVKISWQ